MPALVIVVAILSLLLVGACWAIYQLMVQQGRLLLQFQTLERKLREQGISTGSEIESSRGLPAGSLLNNFELPALSGGSMTLFEHRGNKLLLIFFDPSCSHSQSMLPQLARLSSVENPDLPRLLIVSTGDAEQNRGLVAEHGISFPVLLQERMEVAQLHMVTGTPMGYLLDEQSMTIGRLLVGAEALLAAAGISMSTTGASSGRAYSRYALAPQFDGLEAGTIAPPFTLPRLDGSSLSLDALRGQRVLLVFSDPDCEPCQTLAPELEQIHLRRGDPRILMIARGDAEANREFVNEHKITFPVVLQRHWEISRAYAMAATPVGYLIDEAGVLASQALVGTEAILKAASGRSVRSKTRDKELAWQ